MLVPKRREGKKAKWRKHNFLIAFLKIPLFFALAVVIVLSASYLLDGFLPENPQKAGNTRQGIIFTSMERTGNDAFGTGKFTAKTTSEMRADIVEKAADSVVCIKNLISGMGKYSEGSGIILSSNGYIATNAHVLDGALNVKVLFEDGDEQNAEIIGIDRATDLALIKVEKDGLTPAKIGDSDEIRISETVFAIGNPGGLVFNRSVTQGIISAKNRPIELNGGYVMDMIQTDAAINPGNSGGPLINEFGEVIGINSAKYAAPEYEGIGFAIGVNDALPVLNELKEKGEVKREAGIKQSALK